jgi:branched-chain amino acid transport system ATP-binding protein
MPDVTATIASAQEAEARTAPVLRVEKLSASYGRRRILHDVDFEVHAGQVLAILGRNGAGKSTVLMSIAGHVSQVTGTVTVDSAPLAGSPHRRARQLGLVNKGRSLFPSLSVADNLAVGGVAPAELTAVFPELADRLTVRAGMLSGGEQQMLTVGRALLRGPRVLMLDELTAGLSPAMSERIVDVVVRETAARKMAVIVVEQHLHVAEKIAHRGLIMGEGRVQLSLGLEEFRDRADEIENVYLGRPAS